MQSQIFICFNVELFVRRLVKVYRCGILGSFYYKHRKCAIQCYIKRHIVNLLITKLKILILSKDGLAFFLFQL